MFDKIVELFNKYEIPLENMIGFGSDGAPVMRGKNNSVLSRLKKIIPYLFSLHCLSHGSNLAASHAS